MSKMGNLLNGYLSLIRNRNLHRRKDVWIFGEWFGKKCCDNCLYLANSLCETHPELELYWIAEEGVDTSALSDQITVIQKDTEECRNLLYRAGVVVMNQEFLDFSVSGQNYFSGAITINLWHGLMWKKIGYDLRKRHDLIARIYQRIERKMETADYWLATSPETQRHFEQAYHLNSKQIIKAGYPRNSLFHSAERIGAAKQKIAKIIQNRNSVSQNEPPSVIITYMPTFRDKTDAVFSFLDEYNSSLENLLKAHNAIVVEKSHFVTTIRGKHAVSTRQPERIIQLNDVQATELLAATDILITDYSSCFFDFLLLNRPIIHFIYDYDYYVNNDRGVYYTKDEIVCGKTPVTFDELLQSLEEYLQTPHADEALRIKQKKRFWEFDSSDSCEKIYQQIREIQKKRYNR